MNYQAFTNDSLTMMYEGVRGLPRVMQGRRVFFCDWDHSIGWVPVHDETHQRGATPSREETIQCAKIIPS
jgi:hypothetical protein